MYFVYLLECEDGSLYTGITTDVARRFAEHQNGIGSRFTRAKKVKRIAYTEEQPDRSAASKREAEIKALPRAKKVEMVRALTHGTPEGSAVRQCLSAPRARVKG